MNFSCHPVSNQRQGLAPTSLRVGDRPLCSPSCAPCPSSVVSEGRWNQEQLQAPGSRSVTLCAHRDFLSLLPTPQTRPVKGNGPGNSRCCKYPSQSQRHDLSVAGEHPAQPSASQTSTPHLSRYHSQLCLEMTTLRRVRREDHLRNSGVFLPTGEISLWDAVEKNWATVQGAVHGLFRGSSRDTEMEGARQFVLEQTWEESWKQGQEGLMPYDHGADPCAGLAMPVALPCLSPCQ